MGKKQMSTPVVLDGEFVNYTKTKDGFQVTFSVTPDQQKALHAIASIGKKNLSIVIVTTEELEALNGDLH